MSDRQRSAQRAGSLSRAQQSFAGKSGSRGCGLIGAALLAAAAWPTGAAAQTTGTEFVLGGNFAVASSQNSYDMFPGFTGSGLGAGGDLGIRMWVHPNVFIGGQAGFTGFSVTGNNPDGAFVNLNWQANQLITGGVRITSIPQTPPAVLHVGAGWTEGGVEFGVRGLFLDSTTKTFTGPAVRGGVEFEVTPKFSVGATYQFSHYSATVNGDPIKADINTGILDFKWRIPVGDSPHF